jgi:hypothetical protein
MKASFESLSQKSIALPGNPFWHVLKRFGRDEGIAMVVNIIGTAIMSVFSSNPALLSLVGPVVEKVGFFPAHFIEAWNIYKTTPLSQRSGLFFYFKKAFKGGFISLVEDVLIHDPIYIGLMFLGLYIYQGTPPWLLAAASFIIAVIAVAFIEVGITELRYMLFKWRARKMGFHIESYFESRFLISAKADPDKTMDLLSKKFGLDSSYMLDYKDNYFDSNFPTYSDRVPKFRLRMRSFPNNIGGLEDKDWVKTIQIVYTRASEVCEKVEQCRFFPIKKDKIYYTLKGKMPFAPSDIAVGDVSKFVSRHVSEDSVHGIDFIRVVAQSPDLLVSADRIRGSRDFYILELKTYKNTKLLVQAMRFIMKELPVVQTTYGKSDLTLED